MPRVARPAGLDGPDGHVMLLADAKIVLPAFASVAIHQSAA